MPDGATSSATPGAGRSSWWPRSGTWTPSPPHREPWMALEIVKTFEVNAAPDAVWSFLTDLPRVARCLPGAAIGDKLDEKTSTGTMTIKVGPVSSTYRGKVIFERLDPGARTAEIVASGQDVRGKGGADLKLTSSVKALPGGKTEVTAVSLVNVT